MGIIIIIIMLIIDMRGLKHEYLIIKIKSTIMRVCVSVCVCMNV